MAWAPEMFHTGLVNDQVPGDIVECGAWRGGASIFSKGVVDVLDPTGGRKILVADTFVGFPAADKNDGVDTDGWAYQNFHVGGSDAVVATFKRYGVFRPHSFQMRRSNLGDHRRMWPYHFGARRNFAGRVHTDFKYRSLRIRRHPGQRDRNAEMIVEGLHIPVRRAESAENLRQHFLHTGFANRACNSTTESARPRACSKTEFHQCIQRVFDNDNACLFWHFAVHVPIYSSTGTIPIVTLHAQLLTSSQLIRYLIEISFWLKKA